MLPTGTVTFLFCDIQGSTQLLQRLGGGYERVLNEHQSLLRDIFTAHNGVVVDTQGDSFFVAFPRALDAISAAAAAQRALYRYEWGEDLQVSVRMGLHTGEPTLVGERYVGMDVHRAARIGSAGYGGQVLVSETTQILVKSDLPEGLTLLDLGAHRLKDLRTPKHLYQLVIDDLPSEFPPLKTLDATPNNLPVQLTNFVGRELDIAEIKRQLTAGRMVTLTGSGGSGKTRLSIQVAGEVFDHFHEGVWFVELAPLSDGELIPQTIATALKLREQTGEPTLDTLTEYLSNKELLLILDNCEHLIEACARLADHLLHACRHLKILASSREALGIGGEVPYRVPSLSLPDPLHLSPATLTQYEAVRLFIDRAVTLQPAFTVNNQNAPAVAQICARLDGIPLALELAAARIKVLSVEQIAKKLDDRFHLLTGGSRTALPRHQTLRAAIDWSYDLLTEPERALSRRLSVFAGGWSLEAAEAVCADDKVRYQDILDLLMRLVDKSLMVVDEDMGEARYGMLETVRQYAWDKLREEGEVEAAAARHFDFFLQLAEQAEPQLTGPAQGAWLHRLETEYHNLRSALTWSEGVHANAEHAVRLAGALWRFWYVRGYFREGQRFLEGSLKGIPGTPSSWLAKAFNGAGMMAFEQGDYGRAQPLLEKSVELYRQVQDEQGTAFALTNLGRQFYSQGRFDAATSLLEESLALARHVGDKQLCALALNGLGEVARYQADYERAREYYAESLALAREAGDIQRIMEPLYNLGALAHRQGDDATARSLFEKGLELSQQVGDRRVLVVNLGGLAGVSGSRGEFERAARLFGAAEGLRQEIHYQMESIDHADTERDLAAVRTALSENFGIFFEQGRALTTEQAIALAKQE